MAALLIKFGCDVNHKDVAGRHSLFYAVRQGYHNMAIILIANYASCFIADKDG